MSDFFCRCSSAGLKALILSILLSLCVTTLPGVSHAALKLKGQTSLEETYNPKPDAAGDIVLPMPGGLEMVFRLAAVPVHGLLKPLSTSFGITGADTDRAFYDATRRTTLSSSFTASDLPAAWLKTIPARDRDKYCYYLIAKYEVSRLQYDAVMNPSRDISHVRAEDARPVTDISWNEAMAFTGRYTSWLLQNHPDVLPRFAGDSVSTGYLRLPTEAEWEYAAMGGHAEGSDGAKQDFFTMETGLSYGDYAVFRQEGTSHAASSLAGIGSRRPNPLGLYDTAGNAAEMTLDCFRFSVAGALQGSAGGFVRKGGSFLSSREEILPGRREEMAPFLADGPMRVRDLGFRPVLAGINLPKGRLSVLAKEYSGTGAGTASVDDQALLKDLSSLIESSGNPTVRQNLMNLRKQLEKNISLAQQVHLATIESRLQNCLMSLRAAGYYEYRLGVSQMQKKSRENMLQRNPEEKEKWEKLIASSTRSIHNLELYIASVLQLYVSNMEDIIAEYDKKDVSGALKAMEASSRKARNAWNDETLRIVQLMQKHLVQFFKGSKPRPAAIRGQLATLAG